MIFKRIAIFAIIALCTICYSASAKGEGMPIQNGSEVSFNYTLTVDGKLVDSSEGKTPFNYTHGEGKIIPGLSSQIEGMKEGEEKQVTVQPKDAYGEIDPAAFKEVQKSQLAPELKPQVDMVLQMSTPNGQIIPVRISEVKDSSVVLDFNHPLAGKTLIFQIKIVSVR